MTNQKRRKKLIGNDFAEIIIGSVVLAVPVSVTEEIWTLSTEISLSRALLISFISLVFISFFVQTRYSHDFSFDSQKDVAARVLSVYALTVLVSAAILFAIDKLPIFDDTLVAIKRVLLVAFPASFAATVIDSLQD